MQVEPSTSTVDQQAVLEQAQDLQNNTQDQENGKDAPNSNGGQEFGDDSPRTPQRGDHDQDQGNDEDIFIGETQEEAQAHRAMRIAS